VTSVRAGRVIGIRWRITDAAVLSANALMPLNLQELQADFILRRPPSRTHGQGLVHLAGRGVALGSN